MKGPGALLSFLPASKRPIDALKRKGRQVLPQPCYAPAGCSLRKFQVPCYEDQTPALEKAARKENLHRRQYAGLQVCAPILPDSGRPT